MKLWPDLKALISVSLQAQADMLAETDVKFSGYIKADAILAHTLQAL
ncbi:MAG: hypothetical protein ACI97K_002468 [Glaciecola sp.]|jgi:hypothetical protein